MANIKTLTLTGTVQSAAIGGCHCAIRNDSTATAFISAKANFTAGDDGVLSVPAGGAAVLQGHSGTVYVLGTGDVQLCGSDFCENPFKAVSTGSGSGADEVARAAINAHCGNVEIHVTADEKAGWNAKASSDDIPTELPANGGNADTVDNLHADTFMQNLSTWTSGEIKDLILNNSISGAVFINKAVSGMPSNNTWWFGFIEHSADYYKITVTQVGNQRTYTMTYNTPIQSWSDWKNIADGGNAATLESHPASEFALSSELAALEARVAALE